MQLDAFPNTNGIEWVASQIHLLQPDVLLFLHRDRKGPFLWPAQKGRRQSVTTAGNWDGQKSNKWTVSKLQMRFAMPSCAPGLHSKWCCNTLLAIHCQVYHILVPQSPDQLVVVTKEWRSWHSCSMNCSINKQTKMKRMQPRSSKYIQKPEKPRILHVFWLTDRAPPNTPMDHSWCPCFLSTPAPSFQNHFWAQKRSTAVVF